VAVAVAVAVVVGVAIAMVGVACTTDGGLDKPGWSGGSDTGAYAVAG
jgi:hypothetical protein